MLDNNPKVLTYKLIVYVESTSSDSSNENKVELGGLDYIERFKEFIIDNIGSDAIVMEELEEVCK